jgi:hypothetical protein
LKHFCLIKEFSNIELPVFLMSIWIFSLSSGMSLEAGNRRKSPVTLAVAVGYFFSLKKIMRENLSSISNTTYDSANLRYFWKVFSSGPSFHCCSVYYRS